MPEVHQQAADIGVAESERPEPVAQLRDPRARELRHRHRDLERQRPDPRGMDIGARIELAVLEEGQQVHRGEVAGRVVKEHVFRARVRAADLAIRRAGVPGIDGVVVLHARIGAGPGRMPDLIPQIACLHGLRHLAVGAPRQRPVRIRAHRLEEGIGHPHRIVRVLPRDREIGVAVPVGIVGPELDRGEALLGVLQNALDVGLGNLRLLRRADGRLEARIDLRIDRIGFRAVPGPDRREDLVEPLLMHLRAGDQRGDLLLLEHLPVDEVLDVRVIHVADHHLRRAPRRAARLDGPRRPVADLQEAHQPRRLAAARKALVGRTQAREVGPGPRAVLEEPRLAGPEIHDPAIVHQIVLHRLDEAGMRLRMLVGAGGLGEFAGLEIDVVMPLPRTIDAVGPVQPGVEPLRRIRRAHLACQHEAHLVVIGLRIGLRGEVAALPAPVGPGPRQPVEDLPRRGLADGALGLRQLGELRLVRDRAPQERRHALLAHLLERRRHAGLAEVLLRQNVGGDLTPRLGHLDVLQREHHRPVRVADLRRCPLEGERAVGFGLRGGETTFDLHLPAPDWSFVDREAALAAPGSGDPIRRPAPPDVVLSIWRTTNRRESHPPVNRFFQQDAQILWLTRSSIPLVAIVNFH